METHTSTQNEQLRKRINKPNYACDCESSPCREILFGFGAGQKCPRQYQPIRRFFILTSSTYFPVEGKILKLEIRVCNKPSGTLPIYLSKIRVIRSQNVYFKATRFRCTCDCVAQVSGYQNVKSPKIYTNRHLFNFSEECRFNTLSRLANVLTASEFPYVFCSYSSERTKTKRCCKEWIFRQCIFQRANFENCSSSHKFSSN